MKKLILAIFLLMCPAAYGATSIPDAPEATFPLDENNYIPMVESADGSTGTWGKVFFPANSSYVLSGAGFVPISDESDKISVIAAGAIANDGLDDSAAFADAVTDAVTNGISIITAPANSIFDLASTFQLPLGMSFEGGGHTTELRPMASGSYVGNFLIRTNRTVDDSGMDESDITGRGAFLRNFKISNVNTEATNNYGIYVADKRRLIGITGQYLWKGLEYSTNYLDNKYVDSCSFYMSKSDGTDGYIVDMGSMGDSLHFENNTIGFRNDGSVDEPDKYAFRLNACLGGSVSHNIFNGGCAFIKNDAVEVDNNHFEIGSMDNDAGTGPRDGDFPPILFDSNKSIVFSNSHIQGGTQNGVIQIEGINVNTKGNVHLENLTITRNMTPDYPESNNGFDIRTRDTYVTIRNVFRDIGGLGVDHAATMGISVLNGDTGLPLDGWAERSAYLSADSEISDVTIVEKSRLAVGRESALSTSFTYLATNTLVKWRETTGTYYYTTAILYGPTEKLVGHASPEERSLALTADGDGALLRMNPDGTDIGTWRIYRGSASGVYEEYVDIPTRMGYNLYDEGESLNGVPWVTNTNVGDAIDDFNEYGTRIEFSNTQATLYAATVAAPLYGDWVVGDRVIDATTYSTSMVDLVCTSAGSPGTWEPVVINNVYNALGYGIVDGGLTDNSAAFQEVVDAAELTSGTVLIPEGDWGLLSSVFVPYNVSVLGAGFLSKIKPMTGGSYTAGFLMLFNSPDGNTWTQAYSQTVSSLREIHFDNVDTHTDANYAIYIADKRKIQNVVFSNFAQSIKYTSNYLDLKNLDGVQVRQSQSDTLYAIDTGALGDGLSFNRLQMGFRSTIADSDRKALYINATMGGSLTNSIVNGELVVSRSDGFTISNLHAETSGERLNIKIDNSANVRIADSSIWVGETPGIEIFRSEATGIGRVIVDNVTFLHRMYDKVTFGESSGPDISTEDMVTIIRDCYRRTYYTTLTNSNVTGITVASSADNVTPIAGFNERSTILSKYCMIRDLTVVGYNASVLGGSGTGGNILSGITLDSVKPWALPTDTYYYQVQALIDVDRMVGVTGVESSILATLDGDCVRFQTLVGSNYDRLVTYRLYRGTASGVYDYYVDIPQIYSYLQYDDGPEISGYYWKSRTPGGVDGINTDLAVRMDVTKDNVTTYAVTVAEPTYGTWEDGDRIVRANNAFGATDGLLCITSGTPGNWVRSVGIPHSSTDEDINYNDSGILQVSDEYQVAAAIPSLKLDETDGSFGISVALNAGAFSLTKIASDFGTGAEVPFKVFLTGVATDSWLFEADGDFDMSEGAINIGDTTGTTNGTIKWDGSDFWFRDNGVWTKYKPNYIDITWYGAISGDGLDDSAAARTAITVAIAQGLYHIRVPDGDWDFDSTVSITSADIGDNGFTISGDSAFHGAKITYSGSGYAFSFTGVGSEGGTPLKYINVNDIWVTGGEGNTTSSGGFYIDRAYIVKFLDCASTLWEATGAHALEVRNTFNFDWDGGQLANNFGDDTTGGSVVVMGSDDTSAWNSSNNAIRNTLIQNGGLYGFEMEHDSNIIDNTTVSNVSFGKNAVRSLYIDESDSSNVTIENCHFESGGFEGVGNPLSTSGAHIYIRGTKGLKISNNSMQDTVTYIDLEDVKAFDIQGNKMFETGGYTIPSTTAIKIAATTFNASTGQVGSNEVYTNQIDTLYDFDTDSLVSIIGGGIHRIAESTWSTVYADPASYKNMIANRAASTNAPYDQMYSPDGVNWYRMMISSRYRGECSSIPTEVGSSGYFWKNNGPTVLSDDVGEYFLHGWIYSGGVWEESRTFIGDRDTQTFTADPCATHEDGFTFLNSTSDYMCFCNGAGDDVQFHSPTTACF